MTEAERPLSAPLDVGGQGVEYGEEVLLEILQARVLVGVAGPDLAYAGAEPNVRSAAGQLAPEISINSIPPLLDGSG